MKRLASVLLSIFTLVILASCNSAKQDSSQNSIAPIELTAEQQEIIDLLSIPNKQELMIFDFNTGESYRGFEVWVEVYQNGELIERPVEVNTHSDTAEKRNGQVAIVINQADNTYQWTLSMVENGIKYSHVGTAEIAVDARSGHSFGPMNESASIEDGKEVIIYSSMFAEANTPLRAYDQQTLQEQPELLKEYPHVYLIKCKFTK